MRYTTKGPDHIGYLEDVPCLHLVHVHVVAAVPGNPFHLVFRTGLQYILHLGQDGFIHNGPQSDLIHIDFRDHDLHVAEQHLQDKIIHRMSIDLFLFHM